MENNINLHKAFEEILKERIMKKDLTEYITYDETTDTLIFSCHYVDETDACSLIANVLEKRITKNKDK